MPPYCAVDISILCYTIGFLDLLEKASPVKIARVYSTFVKKSHLQLYSYPWVYKSFKDWVNSSQKENRIIFITTIFLQDNFLLENYSERYLIFFSLSRKGYAYRIQNILYCNLVC